MDVRNLNDLTDAELEELYAPPRTPWLRVNMVSTLDGAATGPEGRSDEINDDADQRVFALLRRISDCVVVGAGTARAEGYSDLSRPLVLVSRRAAVPPGLRDAGPGQVLMATCEEAEHLADARDVLGPEHVLVLGRHRVDLRRLKDALTERGLTRQLGEGGPHLLRDLLAEGVVDELALTVVPRLLAGDGPRITSGPPIDADVRPALLLAAGGTLIGRWLVEPPP